MYGIKFRIMRATLVAFVAFGVIVVFGAFIVSRRGQSGWSDVSSVVLGSVFDVPDVSFDVSVLVSDTSDTAIDGLEVVSNVSYGAFDAPDELADVSNEVPDVSDGLADVPDRGLNG